MENVNDHIKRSVSSIFFGLFDSVIMVSSAIIRGSPWVIFLLSIISDIASVAVIMINLLMHRYLLVFWYALIVDMYNIEIHENDAIIDSIFSIILSIPMTFLMKRISLELP